MVFRESASLEVRSAVLPGMGDAQKLGKPDTLATGKSCSVSPFLEGQAAAVSWHFC